MTYLFMYLLSIVCGVVGGMGMGGGTLLIPMLALIFFVPQKTSQGINLLSFIPMAIIAVIIHVKNKLIDLKKVFLVTITAVLFSVIGFLLFSATGSINQRIYFAVFLIVFSAYQFYCSLKKI